MSYSENTKAFFRSFNSTPSLADRGDVAAMFYKLSRQQIYGHLFGGIGTFTDAAYADLYEAKNKDQTIKFGAIHFYKSESGEGDGYIISPYKKTFGHSTFDPCLAIHFWPTNNSNLGSIRQSMGSASGWLHEVSGEYPMVYGCTYRKLAEAAFRSFGFEHIIDEDEMAVSSSYREGLSVMHAIFRALNGRDNESAELAGVASRTEQLAWRWSKYC